VLRVLPHTVTMNEAEQELSRALVAMVGGTRLNVVTSQVVHHLARYYLVDKEEARVCRYRLGDFLLRLTEGTVANRKLHALLLRGKKFPAAWSKSWCDPDVQHVEIERHEKQHRLSSPGVASHYVAHEHLSLPSSTRFGSTSHSNVRLQKEDEEGGRSLTLCVLRLLVPVAAPGRPSVRRRDPDTREQHIGT
jgi:hypothetical protein